MDRTIGIEHSRRGNLLSGKWFASGISLAVTVGAGYTACTLVFWMWPEVAAGFMNALFHGLDFRRLQVGPTLFDFGSFAYALVGAMSQALAASQETR